MDVTDALRRIVVRHLVLIAIATVISVAAFAGYKATQPATYSATAQVEVADRASTSAQMATSVADTATAYTKANDTVTAALKTAHVTHDVNDFIANDLTVGPVLTAPDIDITVKYTNKQQAVNIAQALAQATTDYFAKQAVSGAQQDKDAMTAQLADVTKQYNDAATAAGKWNGVGTNVNQTLAQGLLQRMDDLTKQINADSQKIAETYRPSIVDQARIVPATTLSKAQPYILVFFVGLILGVGLAAVLESISPSVVGAAGLAGLFGAPFLGYAAGRGGISTVKGKGKGKNRVTDLALAARLHAAARRVGVQQAFTCHRSDVESRRCISAAKFGRDNSFNGLVQEFFHVSDGHYVIFRLIIRQPFVLFALLLREGRNRSAAIRSSDYVVRRQFVERDKVELFSAGQGTVNFLDAARQAAAASRAKYRRAVKNIDEIFTIQTTHDLPP